MSELEEADSTTLSWLYLFPCRCLFIARGIAELAHLFCVNLDWRPCWCCGFCDTICNGLGRAGHMASAQKIGATLWWHAIWDWRRCYFAVAKADRRSDMSCLVFFWKLLLNTFLQGWTWWSSEGTMAAQATLQSAPWRTAPDCSIGLLWACWVPTSLQHSWCGLFLPPCLDCFFFSCQIPRIPQAGFEASLPIRSIENNIPKEMFWKLSCHTVQIAKSSQRLVYVNRRDGGLSFR